MQGMDRCTGKSLSGAEHLQQSIRDILTTPLGSRVMRRDYGSRLFELVDRPINAQTLVDYYAATAQALWQWEPRFRLTRVQIQAVVECQIILTLEGRYGQEDEVHALVPITL